MKDLFQEFRRYTFLRHIMIGGTALAFAVGINVFLFQTPSGVKLQASAIEYAGGKKTQTADVSLVQSGTGTSITKIRLSQGVKDLQEFQATLLVDPSKVKIVSIEAADKNIELIQSSQIEGVSLIVAKYKTPRTTTGISDVANITYTLTTDTPSPANIASTRMMAGNEKYELSSEGTLLR